MYEIYVGTYVYIKLRNSYLNEDIGHVGCIGHVGFIGHFGFIGHVGFIGHGGFIGHVGFIEITVEGSFYRNYLQYMVLYYSRCLLI